MFSFKTKHYMLLTVFLLCLTFQFNETKGSILGFAKLFDDLMAKGPTFMDVVPKLCPQLEELIELVTKLLSLMKNIQQTLAPTCPEKQNYASSKLLTNPVEAVIRKSDCLFELTTNVNYYLDTCILIKNGETIGKYL
ncbi:uncharacterized protein LOC119676773 [Teleopsis dalmanni]|uniref:uncharacterized protein LOC119676773 n=1 Tax=Teleopsis dalmanni TaxID=139649 RepID=UPI0018CF9A90|nr:uncharacterized protein LOC119676773 [Teleopsis dalmanni]